MGEKNDAINIYHSRDNTCCCCIHSVDSWECNNSNKEEKHMNPFKSWISPLHRQPKKLEVVVAFDIETHQRNVDEMLSTYSIKTVSELWFGTAICYTNLSVSSSQKILPFPDQIEDYHFHSDLLFFSPEEFTSYVLHLSSEFHKAGQDRITVFAHNISFDIRAALDFKIMQEHDWDIAVFNPQPKRFVVKFVKGRRQIIFTDTLNLYPASLEKIGKLLGYEKLTELVNRECIDDYTLEQVLPYNVRDTEIVARAVILREKLVNELGGELKLTNPSTAMDVFRRRFMKEKIKKPNRYVRKFAREAYYGGRTEVYYRGVVTTPEHYNAAKKLARIKKYQLLVSDEIHYVDINSLYPYAMKYFPVPTRFLTWLNESQLYHILRRLKNLGLYAHWDFLHPEKTIEWMKQRSPNGELKKPVVGIVQAVVHVDPNVKPPLPVRRNGKLVFPVGTFEGVWTTMELDPLQPPEGVRIIRIKQAALFEADWIFSEYIDTFYILKKESKIKGDSVTYQVAKLFMNSLYGKWAERRRKQLMLSERDFVNFLLDYEAETGNCSIELALDMDYGTIHDGNSIINVIGRYYEVKLNRWVEPYSTPIATFITSTARAVNYAYQKLMGTVYYTDTDSFITDEAGFQKLKEAGLIHPTELGKADEEVPNIAFLEINTVKDYKIYIEDKPPDFTRKIAEDYAYLKRVEEEFWFLNRYHVKYKLKGVPLHKAKLISSNDDNRFKVERLVGAREFLKYGKWGLYWIEQEKELKRVYDKAIGNGWVQPYLLRLNG